MAPPSDILAPTFRIFGQILNNLCFSYRSNDQQTNMERKPVASQSFVCNKESKGGEVDGPAFMTMPYLQQIEQQFHRADTNRWNFGVTSGVGLQRRGEWQRGGQPESPDHRR
jgi:hypothetical protein